VAEIILGGLIALLLVMLVVVKRAATGSVLDKPTGGPLVQLVNAFNLFCLLVVNPLVAVLLVTDHMQSADPSHATVEPSWLLKVLEISGLVVYLAGFLLMMWALITLGKNYQLGGSPPRAEDRLVATGPYRLIRHPMYTAALGISFGLASLTQSWILAIVFLIYLALILLLIPREEEGLQQAFGDQYDVYRGSTKRLIPFAY